MGSFDLSKPSWEEREIKRLKSENEKLKNTISELEKKVANIPFNVENINNIIMDIMSNETSDSHIDGSDTITNFIIALISGKGKEWVRDYFDKNQNLFFKVNTNES